MTGRCQIITADVLDGLRSLPSESVNCCITSPPYYALRDYGVPGQLGLEKTPEEYIANMTAVFCEVRRVLRNDGVLWLNIGDSYATTGGANTGGDGRRVDGGTPYKMSGLPRTSGGGIKPKDLIGIPWMLAFALRADGWYLRCDVIWSKPNPMPESVADRPTKAHEYIFLMAKSERYWYDAEAIRERAVNGDPNSPRGSRGVLGEMNSGVRKQDDLGKRTYTGFNARCPASVKAQMRENGTGLYPPYWADTGGVGRPTETRNKRSVWEVATAPYPEAHFATFPPDLIKPCVLAGCPEGGTVIDPFMGSGTTGVVALSYGRKFIGIELNGEYVKLAEKRLAPVLSQGLLDLAHA